MSSTEIKRAAILTRVQEQEIPLVHAAKLMGVSYRQGKRLYRRFQKHGVEGLVHGNAGKRSNRAKPAKLRRKVMGLIGRHYGGEPGERLGPTLVAEQLTEDHGIVLDAETLRRWMLADGLWSRERKRRPYRKRRERRKHFGELVQMDGSFEDWLEGRAERGCLINMVDDATGIGLGRFDQEESSWAVILTLRAWVERYGIPRALYVDWKNVYHVQPTERQQERGEQTQAQFQRICGKLGIELIGANSAQAKGRVERSHGIHQDRLIKKMRLKKIADYEAANRYLEESYLQQHNAKYAVKPAEEVDFHEPPSKGVDLNDVFSLEWERKVSNDWVVQWQGRWFQIEPQTAVQPSRTVVVQQRHDGSLVLLSQRQPLPYREIDRPVRSTPSVVPIRSRRKSKTKPAASHPWKKPLLASGAARSRQ
jgi:transposase